MNKPFISLLLAGLFAATATTVQAKVRLPHLISDNMVLQQQSDVRLWGWGDKGKTVRVTTSWSSETYQAKVGKDGRFLLTVHTPAASYTEHSITFDDGDKVTVNGVLSGEVWVCAGQSNMEMPVKGFGNCPVKGYNDVVVEANSHRGVHHVKVPSDVSLTPKEDAECHWEEVNMQTVGDVSATGYFFGRLANKALDVPIGLIEANKGGTRVESWLTEENLKAYTDEPLDSAEMVKKYSWDYHRPLLWGNATFNPILKYTVKGIIYYQGCSNVGDPGNQYSERLALLVKQWRDQFGLGEIPFYFVQIAPYAYDGDNPDGLGGAKLREQQLRAQSIIPNSGLVCTNDLVSPYEKLQIHPCQKQQVGERLALQALNKTYGLKSLICESMSFKEMKIEGDKVKVHFNNECGAISRFEDIQGFEVAGPDKVFHPATASHFWQPGGQPWDECVVVTSPEVKNPVAIRYCFKNFQVGNLANAGGLPLFPFRTDNWE